MEWHAARRQHLHARTTCEDLGNHRPRVQHLLAVVEDEKDLEPANPRDEVRDRLRFGDVECVGDGDGDLRRLTVGGQRHEADAVGEAQRLLVGTGDR